MALLCQWGACVKVRPVSLLAFVCATAVMAAASAAAFATVLQFCQGHYLARSCEPAAGWHSEWFTRLCQQHTWQNSKLEAQAAVDKAAVTEYAQQPWVHHDVRSLLGITCHSYLVHSSLCFLVSLPQM